MDDLIKTINLEIELKKEQIERYELALEKMFILSFSCYKEKMNY